jgi:hypothetical protein
LVDQLEKLREGLRAMPVPPPRADFIDRALSNATTTQPGQETTGLRAALRRPSTWWAAGVGALAATLACVAVFLARPEVKRGPLLSLALHESREVPFVIDSERDLADATIRLYVTGSVALDGYEGQHEIEWQVSLTKGSNLLSLPVLAREPGEGLVVAEIEHEGRIRRLSLALHVSAPRGDAHES